MQNLYPESWLYLTGHCYVRSMFVKHHFVAVVVCLLLLFLLLLLLLFLIGINQTVNFLQSYVNFFPISNKVLIIIILYFSQKAQSQMFDMVLNTPLVRSSHSHYIPPTMSFNAFPTAVCKMRVTVLFWSITFYLKISKNSHVYC